MQTNISFTNETRISFAHTAPLITSVFCQPILESLASRVLSLGQILSGDSNQCFPLQFAEGNLQQSMKEAMPCFELQGKSDHGNKFLNLVKMDRIDQALSIPDLNIPRPYGPSTSQVQSLLKKQGPEVFRQWDLLGSLKPPLNDTFSFLENPQAKGAFQTIDKEIQKAFLSSIAANELGLSSPEMTRWLKRLESERKYLMVRSTGNEDSKTLANAGGNLSRAYISPSIAALLPNTGDVVRSYFAVPSIRNRLNGSKDLFNEPLSLAVAFQELIGEPIGGEHDPSKIPVSFVLFTNEPSYTGEEKFRAMRLSATYGHGESVVGNNGIATDSALILHSKSKPDALHILYENQDKTHRLAPIKQQDGKIALDKIPNPASLQKRPALSEKQIQAIYRHGVLMESFFDHPTDIEGVVIGDQVYFVQARPVNRKPIIPTYLDIGQTNLPKLQAEPLVAGQGSVVIAEKKEEILVASTLQEAERLYTPQHKLVIVSVPEPANSHPVVNFSNLGVPCLVASNMQEINSLLTKINEKRPLAVCMQSASLHLWDQTQSDVAESIKEGFVNHPAKIAISLSVASVPNAQSNPLSIPKELMQRIKTGSDGLAALNELRKTSELLQLTDKLNEFSKQRGVLPTAAKKRIAILEKINEQLAKALDEMQAVLTKHPNEKMLRLLSAKALETMLNHPQGSRRALGQYNLSDAESFYQSIAAIINYQKELPFPARGTELLFMGMPSGSEASNQWKSFLLELEPLVQNGTVSLDKWNQFTEIVSLLDRTGAISFWQIFFQKQDNAARRLEDFLQQVQPDDRSLIQEALKLEQSIVGLQNTIDRFADPKSFDTAWSEYENLPNIAFEKIRSASPIAKMLIYRILESQVTLIDTAAKTLKTSQGFSPEKKTKLFKNILLSYDHMMNGLAAGLVPNGAIPLRDEWPMDRYLVEIKMILKKLSDEDPNQLQPSRDFSVSAAMLGAKTAFERHLPRTLEDILTLVHQNSLASLDALNQEIVQKESIQESLLPDSLKQAIALVERGDWGQKTQRLGIETRPQEIIIRYNVPLRNHSGHLDLRYDLHSNKISLHGQLLGDSRERWKAARDFILALEMADLYQPARPLFMSEQELSFFWDLKPDSLDSALKDYAAIADYSLTESDQLDFFSRLTNRPDALEKIAKKLFSEFSERNLSFYLRYVQQSTNLGMAVEAAKTNMIGSSNHWIRRAVLKLFEALFEKGEGFDAAIEAIKEYPAKNSDPYVFWILFNSLVSKGQGFEMAFETIKEHLAHKGERRYDSGLYDALALLKTLVQQGQQYDAAIEIVKTCLGDEDWLVREAAQDLLKELSYLCVIMDPVSGI